METNENDPTSQIRSECWESAFHLFGTKCIFEQRTHALRLRLRLLAFLGIAVPAIIGSSVAAFGTDFAGLTIVLTIGSIVGIFQLVTSIWALTAKWDDGFAFANEAMVSNQQLSTAFQSLAKNPATELEVVKSKFDLLNVEKISRDSQDERQGISPAEKRFGMRAALRQFRRCCVCCKKIPPIKPSKCDVCGNFKVTFTHKVKEKNK